MFGKFDITFCLNAIMCPRRKECGRFIDNYDKKEVPKYLSMSIFTDEPPRDCHYFFPFNSEN